MFKVRVVKRFVIPSSSSHCDSILSISPSGPTNLVSNPQADSQVISSSTVLTICGFTTSISSPESSAVICIVSLSQLEELARLKLMEVVSNKSCSGISITTIRSPGATMQPSGPINAQLGCEKLLSSPGEIRFCTSSSVQSFCVRESITTSPAELTIQISPRHDVVKSREMSDSPWFERLISDSNISGPPNSESSSNTILRAKSSRLPTLTAWSKSATAFRITSLERTPSPKDAEIELSPASSITEICAIVMTSLADRIFGPHDSINRELTTNLQSPKSSAISSFKLL